MTAHALHCERAPRARIERRELEENDHDEVRHRAVAQHTDPALIDP
jgi:hypothetical protein